MSTTNMFRNRGLEPPSRFVETIGTRGDGIAVKRSVSLAVLVVLACGIAPSVATAAGKGGSRGGHFVGSTRSGFHAHKRFSPPQQKSVFPQPVDPWKSWGPSHIQKHHHGGNFHGGHTPFVGTPGFVGTPSVVVQVPVATEVVDASTTIVYASPAMPAATAPPAVSVASALPTPTLVDLPGGWYQLRGDGVTMPYSWVWIPKPPPAPADPATSSYGSDGPPRSAEPSARDGRGSAYHWTDDRGVTTFTNRLDRIPKRFRDQAQTD
jgi:hypothetical protein